MKRDIDERLAVIAAALPMLVHRLRAEGYVFVRPDQVLPGIESDVERNIHRIEHEGGTVPYAIAQFWRRIGRVDFCGSHPGWTGCEYPDPLFVYPTSTAIDELQDFLDDREQRLKGDFPYLIPIAPDSYHKENVSGGMWYNVNCPAIADDPPLNDERHKTTFVGYLEMALQWGGFPGLDECNEHNWPIIRLTAGLPGPGRIK
jgi:hypothetical protein